MQKVYTFFPQQDRGLKFFLKSKIVRKKTFCSSLEKSDHEQITLNFLRKSNIRDLVMIQAYHSQKTSDSLKNPHIFLMFLTVFPPFYVQEQITLIALCSVAFLKEQRERFTLITL